MRAHVQCSATYGARVNGMSFTMVDTVWVQEERCSPPAAQSSSDDAIQLASKIQAAALNKGSVADIAYIESFHASTRSTVSGIAGVQSPAQE